VKKSFLLSVRLKRPSPNEGKIMFFVDLNWLALYAVLLFLALVWLKNPKDVKLLVSIQTLHSNLTLNHFYKARRREQLNNENAEFMPSIKPTP
jgi:hypothetical protein